MTLDDFGPGVTTKRYHNNGPLIMLEVNCIKFSLNIQNSLGIIMCKFHAFQSKNEEMAASVSVFFVHPSYVNITWSCCGSHLLFTMEFYKEVIGK